MRGNSRDLLRINSPSFHAKNLILSNSLHVDDNSFKKISRHSSRQSSRQSSRDTLSPLVRIKKSVSAPVFEEHTGSPAEILTPENECDIERPWSRWDDKDVINNGNKSNK